MRPDRAHFALWINIYYMRTLITSLVGTEKERACLDTWLPYADHIVSVNLPRETNHVGALFPEVEVVCAKHVHMDRYPTINAMLEVCSDYETCILANSDILVNGIDPFDIFQYLSTEGLAIAHRTDYTADNGIIKETKIYKQGYDVFAFNGKVLARHLMSDIFILALPWWDYWLPIKNMLDGNQVVEYPDHCFLHALHDVSWKEQEWLRIGKLFSEKLANLTGDIRFCEYTPELLNLSCHNIFDKHVIKKYSL